MLTGEFEREAEQNANGTDKIASDSPDLAPCTAVADTVGANLIPAESMLTISQFTEKFLEQNLSEYIYMCARMATECSVSSSDGTWVRGIYFYKSLLY